MRRPASLIAATWVAWAEMRASREAREMASAAAAAISRSVSSRARVRVATAAAGSAPACTESSPASSSPASRGSAA